MDHQGKFRRAALELGIPDNEISEFGQYLRLAIYLSGSSSDSPIGQFGGLPRLPVGMDWPSAESRQLPFVFSVNCAALPRVDGFDLPADGVLLFFLDHDEDLLAGIGQEYARVVYVQDGTDTVVAEAPDFLFVDEQCPLTATLHAELPPWLEADESKEEDEDGLSPFQQQLVRDVERVVPHLDELRALADELWPPATWLATAYIGGYVDEDVITIIDEHALAERKKAGEIVIRPGGRYSLSEKEKHQLMSEWILLAFFPASEEHYYGNFAIHHDDLAAARMDKALSATWFTE